MTATRIGRTATLVAFVGAWVVGALLLWRTSVPDLHIHGDARRWFGADQIARSQRYERFEYVLWALALVAKITALLILARRAPRLARSIGLGPIGTGVIIGMLIIVVLAAVSLPFGFAAQWWAARHGLAPHDYFSWIFAPWAALTFQAVFALVTIAIVMGLALRFGERWWLIGAPVFAALAAVFAFTGGYVLAIGTHQVRDPQLRTSLLALEPVEGVEGTPIRVQTVSSFTTQVNAFAAGFGPSSHVVLWNTLLDGRLGDDEVRFVTAHELGHVAHKHILKGLAWFALLALPIAWFVTWVTRRQGGLANPASLPLALVALTIANLIAAPAQNWVSRRYEAEADWSALRATHDVRSGKAVFRSFQETSLQDPSPPHWAYLWLSSHPTLAQRLAMVDAYAARARRGAEPPAGS
jgi:STE24 endopeptidase